MRPEDILVPTPAGVCCKLGGFHIDPTRPVERALITHAHSDHARAGHGAVLATQETLDLMRLRYGENFAGTTPGDRLRRKRQPRRRESNVPSRRPCARLGADRGRGERAAHRRLRRLQGRRRSDLRAVRTRAVRRLHHRGDVRAAGVPPRRSRRRDREASCIRSRCFRSARISSAPIRSARRNASSRYCARPATPRRSICMARWRRSRATTQSRGIALGELRPVRGAAQSGARRHHHALPALGAERCLGAALSRSGHRLRVRLDAHPRPGAPVRRRACRW